MNGSISSMCSEVCSVTAKFVMYSMMAKSNPNSILVVMWRWMELKDVMKSRM